MTVSCWTNHQIMNQPIIRRRCSQGTFSWRSRVRCHLQPQVELWCIAQNFQCFSRFQCITKQLTSHQQTCCCQVGKQFIHQRHSMTQACVYRHVIYYVFTGHKRVYHVSAVVWYDNGGFCPENKASESEDNAVNALASLTGHANDFGGVAGAAWTPCELLLA